MSDERWKPNVTVAAVVERAGRYLLVEEASPRGQVLEETTCRFTPTHLVGVYLAPSAASDITYLRFAFTGTVEDPDPLRTLDAGILRTLWLEPAEIEAQRGRHRSELVARCIADHRAGRRFGLDLLWAGIIRP
jgi:hypothetical protein